MRHLRALADAGLNTVHLLPVFDIATIPERRADQQSPTCDLGALPPDSTQQQACVAAVAGRDGFNWGYDPWHYTTPEGSYATNPEGPGRTLEFRNMVASLNRAGLRVVMDVVYNHTTASGQDPRSVLDRIVPGYYHRLSLTGAVETSTCCANTASEHRMMEKLIVDSVVTWARDYKVDGFRFDLMGHHPKANTARRAPRPRSADAVARRRRRPADLPLRRGLELRRGRRRRPLRAGHAGEHGRDRDRHVQRPPARRRPRWRPVRRGSPHPGLRHRAGQRSQRCAGQRHPGRAGGADPAVPRPDQGRPRRQPAPATASSTAPAPRSRARTSTTTAARPGTPPTRRRRSPTSMPTTTRRSSTRCSSSCRRARRWPIGCG